MLWKQISTVPGTVYQLVNDNDVLLTLSINSKSSVFRAECNASKRVFFIRREGLWKQKTVLKNEYGLRIGRLLEEKAAAGSGLVEIDDKKFRYRFKNSPMPEIAIFNEGETVPVATCGLAGQDGQAAMKLLRQSALTDSDLNYFLFALTWYLFLPVMKEKTAGAAV